MLTKKAPKDQSQAAAASKKAPAKQAKKAQTLFDETPPYAPLKNAGEDKRAHTPTRVVVRYDVGFNNHLTIRGKGANLSWSKGIILQNTASDEWTWETNAPVEAIEFKILVNDAQYEEGDNHRLQAGQSLHFTPHF